MFCACRKNLPKICNKKVTFTIFVSFTVFNVRVCSFDVWSRSSFRVTVRASRSSANVGKTIGRVLRTHSSADLTKLIFLANDGFIRYIFLSLRDDEKQTETQ